MDATQGQTGHPQAVEEAENSVQKSAKAEHVRKLQPK